jgi:transposase
LLNDRALFRLTRIIETHRSTYVAEKYDNRAVVDERDVALGSFASPLPCPGYVRLQGNLGSTGPLVLPVEGIGLDVIQESKPEPRIMRYELSDFEWAAIRSFLPNKPRGVPRVDDRRVLNGIFWVLRSGAPWRDLPVSYGPRTTCYNRFVRWRQAGVWDRVMDALAAGHDAAVQMIDTSVVRVH